MMGMQFRREVKGLIFGGLGSAGALALVLLSSAPAQGDRQVPAWMMARCVIESGFYECETPSSLDDEGDSGGGHYSAKSCVVVDLYLRFGTFENLVTTAGRFVPVPALNRLAPKRSPPLAPLFV